jgi:hypothetical protein
MNVLPMLPHSYGVLEDLATDAKGKPQAGTLPQSLFRHHLNISGCVTLSFAFLDVTTKNKI